MITRVFPFFVGSGRSGTTLVRAMFDSHPELSVPGESGFITRLGRHACRRYGCNGTFDSSAFVSDILAHPRFARWGITEDQVRNVLLAEPATTFAEAIRGIYSLYARKNGKPLYGDKTPVYVMHIPYLAGLFPESRFVHIIRDGRDVALSHLSIKEWGPGTIEEAALEWKQRVLAGRRAGENLEPGRYVELRYEELVADPESALRPVCDVLDLPFDDGMLHYFDRVERILDPEYHPQHHKRIALPPTVKLRDWRTQMTSRDAARFEAIAGRLLLELGYERTCPQVSAGIRVEAVARLAVAKSRYLRSYSAQLRKRLRLKNLGR